MRSQGFPFHSGGLGVEGVFARRCPTVRNRLQPFVWGPYALPMVSSAGGVIFGGFQRSVASFRVAGVALGDIQTCSVTCRKSFCVAGAILFCDVFRRCVAVFVAGAALWTGPSSFFAWQAQHFRRVALSVFCKSHWQGCVKWRQGANSVAGVAFCDMCWKLTEASHETSILR